jgi:hypothetical protein
MPPPLVCAIVSRCPYGRCSEGRARAEPWPDEILREIMLGVILGLDIGAGSH